MVSVSNCSSASSANSANPANPAQLVNSSANSSDECQYSPDGFQNSADVRAGSVQQERIRIYEKVMTPTGYHIGEGKCFIIKKVGEREGRERGKGETVKD